MKRKLRMIFAVILLFTSCNPKSQNMSVSESAVTQEPAENSPSSTASVSEKPPSSADMPSLGSEQQRAPSVSEPSKPREPNNAMPSSQVEQAEQAGEAIGNPTPNSILATNPNADFFVVDGLVCMNASDVEWVQRASLPAVELIGTIQRTAVELGDDWIELDATLLPIGTEIYATERFDICLVKVENDYVRYLKWIEG
jgi:hypothetical protein